MSKSITKPTAKQWFSAKELADMKLSGLPTSERRVRDVAQKNLWSVRSKERGKGFEYHPPRAVMALIDAKVLADTIANPVVNVLGAKPAPASTALAKAKNQVPAVRELKTTATGAVVICGLNRKPRQDADLTDIDRARRDASLVLCGAIDEALMTGKYSVRRVVEGLAQGIFNGRAPQYMIDAAQTTYTKPRQGGQTYKALVSRLLKMYSAYESGRKQGDVSLYLVPGVRHKEPPNPLMVKAFTMYFCHPNRPSVMTAWRNAQAWFAQNHLECPAVDTFYRIEKQLPVTIKYRGRMTGSAWKSLLPYVARDVSQFKANDIWVGDGHSFKAKIQHPLHGQPFIPEVTVVMDWVSRKIVGWSVDMAESCVAVSAALRDAMMRTGARPLVYYSDNGSGQTAKRLDHAVHGSLTRLGIAHETGIPGNPQGRGVIERVWSSTLIEQARSYATYKHHDGDENSINKMLKDLNKKQPKTILPRFDDFLIDLELSIQDYNAREHSVIKATPDAHYIAKLDPDSLDVGVSQDEIAALWLPQEERTPCRGTINLRGYQYANKDLVNLLAEGEKVIVRFDINRPAKVWLSRMDGRYLGEALWDGHKVDAFPKPMIDHLREDRVHRRLRLLDKKAQEVKRELGNTVEGEVLETFVLPPEMQAQKQELVSVPFATPEKEEVLNFMETMAWLNKQGDQNKNEVAAG